MQGLASLFPKMANCYIMTNNDVQAQSSEHPELTIDPLVHMLDASSGNEEIEFLSID